MVAVKADILTVSQLTRQVKLLLENSVGRVWLTGEISNWRAVASGHAYFTLKDASSEISAVMFRGRLSQLRFRPDNGLEVVVCGTVTVYEKRGNYQIVCEEMQPKGVGALQLAFERLRRKLSEEGLFDEAHKKPLPLLPRRIGVVTSPTGAAIRDILNVIHRRFGNVHIVLYPARVQGDEAAEEIVEGIRTLDDYGVDVMIVGRGGGSLEDLWCFNEEAVVRAVYEARTPIISAVGHEIDFTLCDFAADVRAPTPSAAAELVVREQEVLLQRIRQSRAQVTKAFERRVEQWRGRLDRAASGYVLRRPEELVRQRRQRTDELRMRIEACIHARMTVEKTRLERAERTLLLHSPLARVHRARETFAVLRQRMEHAAANAVQRTRSQLGPLLAQLDALSPLAILSRGYALAWKLPERALVRDARQLQPGDSVYLKFGSGSATAAVEEVAENGREGAIDPAEEERGHG